MGKPDPQTRDGHRHGSEDQSPQSHREAAGGDLDRLDKPFPKEPGGGESRSGDGKDSKWNLSKRKTGMTRETKIGLALVLVLTCAFGLVVYKRIQSRGDLVADAGKNENPPAKIHGKPVPPTADDDDDRPFKRPRHFPGGHAWKKQQEPPEGGHTHVVQRGTNNGDNPFPAKRRTDTHNGGTQWNLGGGNDNASRFQQPVTFEHEKGDVWDLHFEDYEKQEPPVKIVISAPAKGDNPFGVQQTEPKETGQATVGGFPNTSDNQGSQGSPFANVKTQNDPNHGDGHAFSPPEKSQPKPIFGPDLKGHQGGVDNGQSHAGHQHAEGGPFRKRHQAATIDHGGNVRKTSGTDEGTEYPFGKSSDFKPAGKKIGGGRFDGHKHTYEPEKHTTYPGSGFTAQRPRPGDGLRIYTVKNGDNYWSISRQAYGTARYYRALDAYNRYRIPHPKRMRPGMKVLIPKRKVLIARYSQYCPGRHGGERYATSKPAGYFQDATGRPMYRVGKTDTLGSIAQKHLGRASRWIQIYRLNQNRIKDTKQLTIGTELRLPGDASRIAIAPGRRVIR